MQKNTGQYTIAGPFELVQGGTGALLFDPVYVTDDSGDRRLWGFSLSCAELGQICGQVLSCASLESANYHYQIWKHNMSTDQDVSIAQCSDLDSDLCP